MGKREAIKGALDIGYHRGSGGAGRTSIAERSCKADAQSPRLPRSRLLERKKIESTDKEEKGKKPRQKPGFQEKTHVLIWVCTWQRGKVSRSR